MILGTENDFIHIWAEAFVRDQKKNREILNRFVTAQILSAQERLKNLPLEKLIKLFDVKNQEIIKKISFKKRSERQIE